MTGVGVAALGDSNGGVSYSDLMAWLAEHGVEPDHLTKVELRPAKGGSCVFLYVERYATDSAGQRRLVWGEGGYEIGADRRLVPLRRLPG